MARQITELQAFLASPSDVGDERKVVSDVIAELNRTIAPDLGFLIRLVRWEDVVPAIEERGEQVILDRAEIQNTDVFIGILWNRFGTPTGHANSGTEEEFKVAHNAWRQHGRPRIMFYFCQRPANLVQKSELEQKLAVLNFKESIGRRGIFREFASSQEFETTLRQDMTRHLLNARQTADARDRAIAPAAIAQQGGAPSLNLTLPDLRVPFSGMVRIPAGEFLAGPAPAKVSLTYDFFIDEAPVTNRNFFRFMEETGFMLNLSRPHIDVVAADILGAANTRPDHPVTMVTWYDAQAYAAWVGKRLPASLEWERAARGKHGFLYPWGNRFDPARCNCRESGIGHTTPVRQYPRGKSPDGCFDMAGNVFEWVSDWATSPRFSSAPNSEKVNRGASYARGANHLVCWHTESDPPDLRMSDVGFRCAWTPNEKNQ